MLARVLVLAVGASAGCATTTPPAKLGSRGPTAEDHLAEARTEAEIATLRSRWPDKPSTPTGTVGAAPENAWSPWYYYWDPTIEHVRLAQAHTAAAAQIEAEYETACEGTPTDEVTVSPLQRWAMGGGNIDTGAVVYLDTAAGPPAHLLQLMRCHRAWMRLGRTGMDDCPLDLADVAVVVHPTDGAIEVQLTTRVAALVPELQRRVAHDVEAASSLHRAVHPIPTASGQ